MLLNQIKIEACLSSVCPAVNKVKSAAVISANPVSQTQTIIIKSVLTGSVIVFWTIADENYKRFAEEDVA